jgi:hypothetical protein
MKPEDAYKEGFKAGFEEGLASIRYHFQPLPKDILRLPRGITMKEARRLLYQVLVVRAYEEANHNRAAAARALGMSYKGFLNYLYKAVGKRKSPVQPAIRKVYEVSLERARAARRAKAVQRRAERLGRR